jgi:copper chaperone NosL
MKEIEPESIPELKIMPYIIAGFILLGIIAALLKNKKIVFAWIVMILITFSVGLYDYYMWGYDYGHNLNPTAAIRVPGLTYQPPLIGSKQLLNMRATSMPDIGTYIIIFSLLIFAVVLYLEKKSKKV